MIYRSCWLVAMVGLKIAFPEDNVVEWYARPRIRMIVSELSRAEMETTQREVAKQLFPPEEGWEDVSVNIKEIPKEIVELILEQI